MDGKYIVRGVHKPPFPWSWYIWYTVYMVVSPVVSGSMIEYEVMNGMPSGAVMAQMVRGSGPFIFDPKDPPSAV